MSSDISEHSRIKVQHTVHLFYFLSVVSIFLAVYLLFTGPTSQLQENSYDSLASNKGRLDVSLFGRDIHDSVIARSTSMTHVGHNDTANFRACITTFHRGFEVTVPTEPGCAYFLVDRPHGTDHKETHMLKVCGCVKNKIVLLDQEILERFHMFKNSTPQVSMVATGEGASVVLYEKRNFRGFPRYVRNQQQIALEEAVLIHNNTKTTWDKKAASLILVVQAENACGAQFVCTHVTTQFPVSSPSPSPTSIPTHFQVTDYILKWREEQKKKHREKQKEKKREREIDRIEESSVKVPIGSEIVLIERNVTSGNETAVDDVIFTDYKSGAVVTD